MADDEVHKDSPEKGLSWTVNAARNLWRGLVRKAGSHTAIVVSAAALVVLVAVFAVATRLVGPPFFKPGVPTAKILIAPSTPNTRKAARAAAAIRGARPVVVLAAGNAVVIGLDSRSASAAIISRVIDAVRRALGPFPKDERAINDPANPPLAQVYVTGEAATVDGLIRVAQKLKGGIPLAAIVAELAPLLGRAAGMP